MSIMAWARFFLAISRARKTRGSKVICLPSKLPPSGPVTKIPSPTFAPLRLTGVIPPLRPRIETVTTSFPSQVAVSPPTIEQ